MDDIKLGDRVRVLVHDDEKIEGAEGVVSAIAGGTVAINFKGQDTRVIPASSVVKCPATNKTD